MKLNSFAGEYIPKDVLQNNPVIQVKEELDIMQWELLGRDTNKNNGPGKKQLVVRMELQLLWCCWKIICSAETDENWV